MIQLACEVLLVTYQSREVVLHLVFDLSELRLQNLGFFLELEAPFSHAYFVPYQLHRLLGLNSWLARVMMVMGLERVALEQILSRRELLDSRCGYELDNRVFHHLTVSIGMLVDLTT